MDKRTAIIIPKAGVKVSDPETGRHLPERGRRVKLNTYWVRRVKEGCVRILETRKI